MLAALAVVAVVMAGVLGAAPVPAAAAGSTISGIVYLGDVNTTASAGEVRIKYSRFGAGHIASNVVTTNAQGAFTISGLAAGPWVLYYEYLGTGPWNSRWLGSHPYGSEQPSAGTLNLDGTSTYSNWASEMLESNGSITGRIMLGDGATIAPEGDVEVHWTRYLGGFESETGVGTVGADGYYLLEDLGPSSSYGLQFVYVGSDPRWQGVGYWSINTGYWSSSPTGSSNAVRNGAVVNFGTTIIPAYLTMTGRVTLGSSGTFAGAGDVVVTATTHPDVLEAGVSATTDAEGYYTLTGLRSTSYRLIFTYVGAGDYAAVSRPLTGSSAGSTVNITIAPGYTVSGNVSLDLATRPVGAGEVRVIVENWGGGDGPSTVTDSLGNFQIRGLVLGTYGLRFEVVGSDTYPDWYWTPDHPTGTEYRLTPRLGLSSNRSGLDVVIGAGGFIEGDVVDSGGAPIEGVTVWATGFYRAGPDRGGAVAGMQFSAMTDVNGSYRISGIPGRFDYVVDFESTGFAPTTWSGYSPYYQPELVRPDQAPLPVDVDVVLYAEGSIAGTVTGAGVAEHFDDIQIEVSVFDYGTGRWVRTGDTYNVEPDGTFVVPSLYPDDYRIWARYSGPFGVRSISSPSLVVGEGDNVTVEFDSLLPAAFSFVKADFTGEAVADLLARSSTGDLYLFKGNGSSGWSGQTLVGRGGRSSRLSSPSATSAVTASPT